MRTERVLFVVDTHTGGEPTRIVLGGFPPVNCDSMIERLEYIKEKMDWVRTCVLFEPRGSMESFGAIVLPPIDKRAEFSLIFMNTLGYMYMCGHATIGVAGALSKLGYIRMEEPETEISYETVAGIVNVRIHVKDSVIDKISVKASRKDACVVQDHQCNQRIQQTCVMVRLCESFVQSPT